MRRWGADASLAGRGALDGGALLLRLAGTLIAGCGDEVRTRASLLFSCVIGDDSFLTRSPTCEGQRPEGPVGSIDDCDGSGRVALYRCTVGAGTDRFVSPSAECEDPTLESRLGYALPPG